MRVADRQRWTNAKKKTAGVFMLTGVFLSFGIESSLWWALPALVLTFTATLIIESILPSEW